MILWQKHEKNKKTGQVITCTLYACDYFFFDRIQSLDSFHMRRHYKK